METIDEIVKEMLKEVRESERNNPDRTTRIFLTSANMALKDFACRAKKAAMSLKSKVNDQERTIIDLRNLVSRLQAELNKDDCLKLANDVDRLRAENERLKKCVSGECDRISVDAELCSDCPFAKIDSVRTENERLKAALQPVLDIVMDSATSDLSMELAIKEAKRIYKESMK